MNVFVLFIVKDLKNKRKKETPPPKKIQAFTRTQNEIGGVVFVADDTIFTTAEVSAHTCVHTTILVVFSSKFISVPKSPFSRLSSTLTDFQGLSRP